MKFLATELLHYTRDSLGLSTKLLTCREPVGPVPHPHLTACFLKPFLSLLVLFWVLQEAGAMTGLIVQGERPVSGNGEGAEPPNCNAGVSTSGGRMEERKCGWKLPDYFEVLRGIQQGWCQILS